jgi:hypothetical protein
MAHDRGVVETVKRFEEALIVNHEAGSVWGLLSPYSQRVIPLGDWVIAMRITSPRSGPQYKVEEPSQDSTILNYASVGDEEADIRATPSSSGASEGMIVAPLREGRGWRIWRVH